MTDVTWLPSASALLLGHLCAHVVHVDALRLPSSSSTASGSAPGTHPPSAIITAVSASTRPRSCTAATHPRQRRRQAGWSLARCRIGSVMWVGFGSPAHLTNLPTTMPGRDRSSDLPVVNEQVSRYGQASTWGAVLGCIRPSRSPCASTTFMQLNGRVRLPLGPRFETSTWARTCSTFRQLERHPPAFARLPAQPRPERLTIVLRVHAPRRREPSPCPSLVAAIPAGSPVMYPTD
jgi:hypothetical protein